MHKASGTAGTPELQEPHFASGPVFGEPEIKHIDATRERARAARAAPLIAEARRRQWRLAAIYTAGACAQPLLLGATMAITQYVPGQHPVRVFALLYGFFFLQNGTPVALAAAMILMKRLRFLILAVLAFIAALLLAAKSISGALDPIGLWAMIAGFPTGAVLLLNARRVRAVGPIVFAATLFLFNGIAAGQAYGALYMLDVIGPVHFVREDLARLPLVTAGGRYFSEILNLPAPERAEQLRALTSHPSSIIRPDHPERLTTGYEILFYGVSLLTIVLGAAAGWAFIRWLAYRYRAGRASDQMLNIDVLMVIFTLSIFLIFLSSFGLTIAMGALAGFAGYKLFTHWQLQRRRGFKVPTAARTLLLLRVFRSDGQRLLEDLMQRWRYLGPIRLIAGTDLVESTIEPHEFFDFLGGRLTRAFVKGKEDLEYRLSDRTLVPDPDGLYRIEDFFCHSDNWQMTVSYLAQSADAVLMDLRGFTSARRGCTFEIQMLMRSVHVNRVVFLVNDSTDFSFLDQTLRRAWQNMPSDSPNVDSGQHQVRLIRASGHRRTRDCMLGLLCESFASSSASVGDYSAKSPT